MSSDDSQAFLGAGWSFPPQFLNRGKELLTSTGPENIHKSIWVILNTRIGERVMKENFGGGLHNLQFESLTTSLVNNLKNSISSTILLHEPRVKLDEISVSSSNEQEGLLIIELHYTVKSNNSRYNLVYPFYLENK